MKLKPLAALFLLAAAAWPQTVRQANTMFPPVRGTREMVGAANNVEVEAGFRMLMQGGNAVDAAVATVLAAAVSEQDHFGLGGEIPILIKMAGKPVTVISGVGVAPGKATIDFYLHRKPEPFEEDGKFPPIPGQGILAATVPGMFDGILLALETYGTKSFSEVVQPAIELADGLALPEIYASYIKMNQRILELWPASRTFFMPNGTPPVRGELFRAPTLAKTLRELAAAEKRAHGKRAAKIHAVRDYFYKGPLAQRMADFCAKNGGLITTSDLAKYHAEFDTPRTTTYRGYEVNKPGFWTQGPVMLEALNMLESFDLKSMGHNSPEYLHTVIEAVKLAFADRDRYYGDPKFSEIPEQTLLSKDYAAERRKLIDKDHASMDSRPGDFGGKVPMPTGGGSSSAQDTTCVNVVDRWGNVWSSTPSGAWLPSVIMGDTGIPLGTRLQTLLTQPGHPNALAPGKRPRVTLSPTMVLKDGKPYMALSTPGGDNQDQALLQVFLNIVEFGMTPQEAVEAPRFQTEHFYSSFAFHEFVAGRVNIEGRVPRAVTDRLAALGHKVNVTDPWSNASAPTVIQFGEGVLSGGADPRRSRFIFGR